MGTSKSTDSSAAFLFEVPVLNVPLVVQELQIGGTSLFFASQHSAESVMKRQWIDRHCHAT
jgi:hypothetical protein